MDNNINDAMKMQNFMSLCKKKIITEIANLFYTERDVKNFADYLLQCVSDNTGEQVKNLWYYILNCDRKYEEFDTNKLFFKMSVNDINDEKLLKHILLYFDNTLPGEHFIDIIISNSSVIITEYKIIKNKFINKKIDKLKEQIKNLENLLENTDDEINTSIDLNDFNM